MAKDFKNEETVVLSEETVAMTEGVAHQLNIGLDEAFRKILSKSGFEGKVRLVGNGRAAIVSLPTDKKINGTVYDYIHKTFANSFQVINFK